MSSPNAWSSPTRRRFLGQAALGSALVATPAWAQGTTSLGFPGVDERNLTKAFPQKGEMILQRTRPPLLETPFGVFDKGVFTPNDQFFVRWHWSVIPTEVKVETFRLAVRGHVNAAHLQAPVVRLCRDNAVQRLASLQTAAEALARTLL